MQTLLEKALQQLGNRSVMCFVDALDECDETQIGESSVENGVRFLTCFASRHYPRISIRRSLEIMLEQQQGHSQDITNYIEIKLEIGKTKMAQQVRAEVQEKATGVFMWVVLVVGILDKTYFRGRLLELRQKLDEIPGDLHSLFLNILTRDTNNKEEVVLCIQWVLFAKQPLSPEQLYCAILSGSGPSAISAWEPDEITQETISNFILDCFKGLTDITVSKNRQVQFIHESVRDFLLKEDGLSKAWPEYNVNFQGRSHERLKHRSKTYLATDLEKWLKIPNPLPKASSPEAKNLRRSARQQYPLLEYAVQNIFYHTDLAESHGISQARFLDDFKLERWVQLDNMLQKFDSRRHQPSVSLLYILAELDCANLIHLHLPKGQVLRIEADRYGFPLFAAVVHANNAATQALSTALRPASPGQIVENRHAEIENQITVNNKRELRRYYRKNRRLMLNAKLVFPEWLTILLLGSSEYDTNSPPSEFQYALFDASEKGYEDIVELLLRNKAAILDDQPDSRDRALHAAIENGHGSIVKLLVFAGANIEAKNRKDCNAIHIASREGFLDIVVFLLDNRPDLIDSRHGHGTTALMLAIAYSHETVARILLERGGNVEFQCKIYGNALAQASSHGPTSLAMLLLDKGSNVNARNIFQTTALHVACRGGYVDLVKLLLERGAKINAYSYAQGTALHTACREGHKRTVKLLLDKGAEVNAQDRFYGTALTIASKKGHTEIVELLVAWGAKKNPHNRLSHSLRLTPQLPSINVFLRFPRNPVHHLLQKQILILPSFIQEDNSTPHFLKLALS